MNKIKTAVVGTGSLGRHHVRWLSQIPRSELVGVYDIDGDKRRQYAEEYGVTAFGSLDEVADTVQACSIAATTSAHYDVAAHLIDAGVHCLIEKPVTATLEQSDRLQRLAEQRGVKVAVGHIERFNPAIQSLHHNDIRPAFIEAHRLAAFDPRGADVAVVLDLMIHDIDLCLMLTGSRVVDIHASAVPVVSEQADIANARLTFESGAVANLTASRISLKPMRKLRIFQKSGYYSLDLAKKEADLYRMIAPGATSEGTRIPIGKSNQELLYTKVNDTGEDMLGAELAAFLTAVAEDGPVAVSIAEAAEALAVALEVERIGLAAATPETKETSA